MMKALKYILPFALILSLLSFIDNDFHTSTTKIELDEGGVALTFTSKFVTEDLVKSVGISDLNSKEFEEAVQAYLKKNFKVSINGQAVNYLYTSTQTSPKATRLYFEVSPINDVKTIEVKNSMLLDVFSDQQNFMTFSINGKRDNFVSRKGAEVGKLTF